MDKIAELHNQILRMKTVPADQFGRSVIVAPHPDDETLGCGGTAALLLKSGFDVHFIFISDGTMSHPNSVKFPAEKLMLLREEEARQAIKVLGGKCEQTEFLRLKDTQVPNPGDEGFEKSVAFLVEKIQKIMPQSLFVPWQKDPHKDHQATWKIMKTVTDRLTFTPRFIEYPIWLWEMGNQEDMELIEKMQKWSIDIEPVMTQKKSALEEHQSQITRLIDDDPEGFMLSADVLAHFDLPRELFFETVKP